MAIKTFKPTTPSRRHMTVSAFEGIDKKAKPERSLTEVLSKHAGRNSYGRITVRHRGGGNKRKYRIIDFKRDKIGSATVLRLEYDPNRSANIALIQYEDGEKRYILAPLGLKAGHKIMTGPEADILPGNALPIANIPVGTVIHNIELHPGNGAQLVRALLNTGDCDLIAVEVTCDHDHTTRTETPATCTEDGSVTVICDDCDEVLSTETLPATGHSTVVKNAKDATCTEPGYTGDKVCTVCGETGETGETGEVIPAAGHSYKDGKCTVCGAADPNANSGGNTGNNGTDSPNTADGAAMGLWLSLMTVAVLAGAVLVAGKTPRA